MSLGMSIRKCSKNTRNSDFAAGHTVAVPCDPVSAASATDTLDPNFACGVAYRSENYPNDIAAKHGHMSSLIWRGVGLLQLCQVHRAYVCASHMAVSSTCHTQAAQTGISRACRYELACKALKAAENACSEMELIGAASQHVPSWDNATSPAEKLERCICEVSLLNLEACLSACAQMYCSSHPLSDFGLSSNSLSGQATSQQIMVAGAILKSFRCSSHPLQADSRNHLEGLWVERISALVTSTACVPAEVKALVLQCAHDLRSEVPDLLSGGDLHILLERLFESMGGHCPIEVNSSQCTQ